MGINQQVQKLEAGNKVQLVEVDCREFGGDVLRFHNYQVPHTEQELLGAQESGTEPQPKPILWQGNEYACWPYKVEGIEVDSTTSSPTPTLTVANVDRAITALCLQFQNLYKARVNIRTTFEHFLDGRPEADPSQEFVQTWYIARKFNENRASVGFELNSPADLTGRLIPVRQIQSSCQWALNNEYRGPDCGYTGTTYFDADGNPVSDPALDQCGGLLSDCKKRFGESSELPFGGFIGSSLLI